MEFAAISGPNFQKLTVYMADLNTTGPVLVEAGTNQSWPQGVEVSTIKASIQNDYTFYKDKVLFIYSVHDEDSMGDIKDRLWDEYVLNGQPKLTVSIVDLQPEESAASPSSTISTGVNIPLMLSFIVKIQDSGNWEQVAVPNPEVHNTAGGCTNVTSILLKKCVMSQLALEGGRTKTNSIRIFRNSEGYCYGAALKGNDQVWPKLWYMAILNELTPPVWYKAEGATPDALDMGWNAIHSMESDDGSNGWDGPQ